MKKRTLALLLVGGIGGFSSTFCEDKIKEDVKVAVAPDKNKKKVETKNKDQVLSLEDRLSDKTLDFKARAFLQNNPHIPKKDKAAIQEKLDSFFVCYPKIELSLDPNFSMNPFYMERLLNNFPLAMKLIREYTDNEFSAEYLARPYKVRGQGNDTFKGDAYFIHVSKRRLLIYAEGSMEFLWADHNGSGIFYFEFEETAKNRVRANTTIYFAAENKLANFAFSKLAKWDRFKAFLEDTVQGVGGGVADSSSEFTRNPEVLIKKIEQGTTKEKYSKADIDYLKKMIEDNKVYQQEKSKKKE